jgi:histidinol-phosphate aminotransferase
MLSEQMTETLVRLGHSRRDFFKITALLTAGASLPFYNEAAMAQASALGKRLGAGAVKINANENPMGITPTALEAYMAVAREGGRYNYEEGFDLARIFAAQEGLDADAVQLYPGSSLALHQAVIAYTGPGRGLVTVDPGYEAAAGAAKWIGAPVTRVPLGKDGRQDVAAMVKAAEGAGAIYLCNPNNPTGTVVPEVDVKYVIENCPSGVTVILDEAYIHFTDEPRGTKYVRDGRDVIVLRTFSKIYGMAGLRAGFAVAKPELLGRLRGMMAGAMPAPAMAAARTMLEDPAVVPERKARYDAARADLQGFFKKYGYACAPNHSNKLMVDTGRPVNEVIAKLAARDVYIGRPWSAWPTHARISIGTPEEMETFKKVFLDVMGT